MKPTAAIGLALACLLCACCGAHRLPTGARESDAILALSGLGTLEGGCPRGARIWTLRFVVPGDAATDTVSFRIGAGTRRTVNVNPGDSVTFRLARDAVRTHEPADRFVPAMGQGRGLSAATWVSTTAPLDALIYQGTEPQTLRADVHVALTTLGGESGRCVLAGSKMDAFTYPNSRG